MPSKVRLKKNTEQLKEGLKSSILGPQNLGSGGAWAPRAPPGSASGYLLAFGLIPNMTYFMRLLISGAFV